MYYGIFGTIPCVNDLCGPSQIALHTQAEEEYCKEGLHREACLEGCIVRTQNLAATLFCPVNGAYTLLNGLCATAYPVAGTCCWCSKSCCQGFCGFSGLLGGFCMDYFSANVDFFCDATCPLWKITCLQVANLGIFALKCPGSVIVPELQGGCCDCFDEPLNTQIERYEALHRQYISDITPDQHQFP